MADLKVDDVGLQSLVTMLRSFADGMQEATSALESAQASGLGHRELEAAADHFASEWSYGIGQLRKASTTVATELEDGIRGYSDCDAQLANEVRKAMTKP